MAFNSLCTKSSEYLGWYPDLELPTQNHLSHQVPSKASRQIKGYVTLESFFCAVKSLWKQAQVRKQENSDLSQKDTLH